jgi:hypothetical protein
MVGDVDTGDERSYAGSAGDADISQYDRDDHGYYVGCIKSQRRHIQTGTMYQRHRHVRAFYRHHRQFYDDLLSLWQHFLRLRRQRERHRR